MRSTARRRRAGSANPARRVRENLFRVRAVRDKAGRNRGRKFSAWPRRNRRGRACEFRRRVRRGVFGLGLASQGKFNGIQVKRKAWQGGVAAPKFSQE